MERSKTSILAENYYNDLYPVYEKMIEFEVESNSTTGAIDNWLKAETKLNECLNFLEEIWSKDKEKE